MPILPDVNTRQLSQHLDLVTSGRTVDTDRIYLWNGSRYRQKRTNLS